jgi:hypothetical protein
MYILESIPFLNKTGWIAESIPMFKREAEALLKSRRAFEDRKFRYKLTKV